VEEIKVGEYVRTKLGDIKKITEGFEFIIEIHNRSSNKIVKHSKNIIDLIEVGDYVNGVRVINILDKDEEKIPTSIKCVNNCFYEKEIKSIVTKEQFSSVEYRLQEGDK
jgi:hypothetical protein